MPLPKPWVDRIFEKLTLVYGHAFLARWRDLDMDAVKADWAQELDGFDAHPESIGYALRYLPEKPPSVVEFRALCRRAPLPSLPRLDSPCADPERMAAEVERARKAAKLAPQQRGDGKDWARCVLAAVGRGEKRSPNSVRIARDALRRELADASQA